tara:strand:- start:116 stop:964 length:849 start_codon:yes stop_codon:yes gene_type:complete
MFGILSFVFLSSFAGAYTASQCESFPISKGEKGEGVLRYCSDSRGQELYMSGEMDVIEKFLDDRDDMDCEKNRHDREMPACRDFRSFQKVMQKIQKREKGTFEVVTHNAHGGEVSWHQRLMKKVEDSCLNDCKIITRLQGVCESACTQMHITCTKNSVSYMEAGGGYFEHATNDDVECGQCDPKNPENCNICDPKKTVKEYTNRCDPKLIDQDVKANKRPQIEVSEEKARQVAIFAEDLRKQGVFSSDTLTRVRPPWFEYPRARPHTTPTIRPIPASIRTFR